MSGVFRSFSFSLAIDHITTIPYFPNPWHSERLFRNLKAPSISFHSTSQKTWDRHLYLLQFSFNTARQELNICI